MSESFQEYKARLLGYVGARDPVAVIRETPAVLEPIVRSVPAERLTVPPAPGKWSIAEILAHLADDELILGYRMRSVLVTPGSEVVAFDQDRWAGTMRYRDIPAQISLDAFRQFRRWNLEMLDRLSPEEWGRSGIHQERGKESVRDMVLIYAGHDINHMNQIRRIVEKQA